VDERAKRNKRHAAGSGRSSGIRIIGAEQVADIVASQHGVEDDPLGDHGDGGFKLPLENTSGEMKEELFDRDQLDESTAEDTLLPEDVPVESTLGGASPKGEDFELPHWSDPPTGQVPAVLHRSGDGEESTPLSPSSGAPVWREYDSDWEMAEDLSEVFTEDNEPRLGALDPDKEDVTEMYNFAEIDALISSPPLSPPTSASTPISGPLFSEPSQLSQYELERIEKELAQAREAKTASEENLSSASDREVDDGMELQASSTSRHAYDVQPEESSESHSSSASSVLGQNTLGEGVLGEESEDDEPTGVDSPRPARARDVDGYDTYSGDAYPSEEQHLTSGSRRHVRRKGRSAKQPRSSRDVLVSVITGVVFGAVAVAAFELGSAATLALCALILFVAGGEALRALRRAGKRPASSVVLVGIIAILVGAYKGGVTAIAPIAALVVAATLVYYVLDKLRGTSLEQVSLSIMIFAWIGILGSFAGVLLDPSVYPHRNGVAFLVGAIIATVAYDVGGLFVGATLGRHRLAPTLSPGKTVEGLIGATLVAVAVAVAVVSRIHPWDLSSAALLGCVVAVVAPLGDLSESLIKRDLHLKDMGSLLPGHGGFIDRIDGLLFAIPATYELIRLLHLV
jgi:CDP-diglyceride synthetase